MITLYHFLILGAIVFTIGLYGALAKKSVIAVLMSIELMLNAVNINLVAFNKYLTPDVVTGYVFVVFIITVAAAEIAIALALAVRIYKERMTSEVDEINILKW